MCIFIDCLHYSDKDTLPDDVLVPQFSGNADFVDIYRQNLHFININNYDFLHRNFYSHVNTSGKS